MKKPKYSVVGLLLVTALGGCTATSRSPMIISEYFAIEHFSSKQDILNKAKQVFLRDGFQIMSTDLEAEYISTTLGTGSLRQSRPIVVPPRAYIYRMSQRKISLYTVFLVA